MKIEIITNDVINGDTFITPYWVANGNLSVRQQNAGASVNGLIADVVDANWEKVDNKAWISSVNVYEFMTVYFRRIRAQ